MAEILVTGGTGFLGRNTVPLLLDEGHRVTNLGLTPFPDSRVKPVIYDILKDDLEASLKGCDFDFVIHFAAFSTPKIAVDYEQTFTVNVDFTRRLLERARGFKRLKNFFFFSTATAYSVLAPRPIREEAMQEATEGDYYSLSKIEAEKVCRSFQAEGMPVLILRLTNNFGPHQAWESYPNLVPQLIKEAILDRHIRILNGEYRRDFLFSGDFARILVELLKKDVPYPVMNVATGKEMRIAEMAGIVGKSAGVSIYDAKKKLAKSKDLQLDVSRLHRMLPAFQFTPMEEALRITYDYYSKVIPPALTKISFILPTFEERGHIVTFLREIMRSMDETGIDYELILVDDNSSDGTGSFVDEMFKRNPKVNVFIRKEERGLASAIRFGIERAKGSHIFLMDTDFNHDPRYIKGFLGLGKHYDIVSGSRYTWGGDMEGGRFRYFGSLLFNIFLSALLRLKSSDNTGGFVLFRRSLLASMHTKEVFKGYGEFFFRFLFAAKCMNASLIEVPVVYPKRASGVSKTFFFKYFFIYSWVGVKLLFSGRTLLKKP